MGSIEKRGKDSWRIGIQVKNDLGEWEWIRETLKLPGLTDRQALKRAETALAILEDKAEKGLIKPKSAAVHTLRSFAEYWLENYVKTNLEPNTYTTYYNLLKTRVYPLLGDLPLTVHALSPRVLIAWLSDVRDSPKRSSRLPDDQLKNPRHPVTQKRIEQRSTVGAPLSPRTIQHYYDTLAALFDKAVQWDVLPYNPLDKVDRPYAPKIKAKYLDEDQAVRLLRCLKEEPDMGYRAAVLLALLCGLRLGEVGALTLDDVDWEKGTIDISRALKYTSQTGSFDGDPKTDAGLRLIALPAGMMALLHELREYQVDMAAQVGDLWQGHGWIVHGWNGRQRNKDTPSKWFRQFSRDHGFDVTFHQLRHTHATILLANNIDAVAVASRLGHANATTTLKYYAHALRRRDNDAADISQDLFTKSMEEN